MNILFLRGFNNYFNRVIKKYSALTDYQSRSTAYVNFDGINFNPNDGVATELVLGNESQQENSLPLDWENIGTPDYCVCYEMSGSTPAIKSRWYVLESERLRSGQYRLALKRDVVAEHFDTIKVSPCFIEKGMVNDIENTLLYNKESMSYNQIKTAEYPLKDSTECGWIIGYVPKNMPDSAGSPISTTILMEGEPVGYYESNELPFSVGLNTNYAYDSQQMNIELVQLGSYINTADYATTYYSAEQYINSYVLDTNNNITKSYVRYKSSGTLNGRPSTVSAIPTKLISDGYFYGDSDINWKNMSHLAIKCSSRNQQVPSIYGFQISSSNPAYLSRTSNSISSIASLLRAHASTACNTAFSQYGPVVDGMEQYNEKYVKYNNKFYKMVISKVSYRSGIFKVDSSNDWSVGTTNKTIDGLTQYSTPITNSTDLANLRNDIATLYSTAYYSSVTNSYDTRHSFDGCAVSMPRYSITLEQISTETLIVQDRAASSRNHTYDNSADLFAIPYGVMQYTYNGDYNYTSANRGLAIARAIAARYSDSCYDLQLVPYCPSATARTEVASTGEIQLDYWDAKTYQIYTSNDAPAGFVLWVSASKDTFDINLNLQPNVGDCSTALKYKLTNETELCRLASPNFSGQFEFSLAKNNGITKFNIDYTYKPYAPYIHVNPDFKGLYAPHWNEDGDWDDARGLICGGDFSLNHITSYWQTYMNNNKNYQQIFDRQIQNMDVNNAIALEKQEFQATVGTITSAIGGAMGGGVAGATAGAAAGPWGALIGGVVGAVGGGIGSGVASAYGAEKDRDWLQRQQAEARSFAIDMYGYQLGNIQAMPYSIKGTDALTNNNKIWPILEVYNATDMEVELLKNKIQYNGMTIMAVGNIKDYCTSEDFSNVFVKGQMIKLNSDQLNDDFHIADAIYQEINKGVYIPSGGL